MKENKRKIVLIISILLIITIVVLGLIYFKTNKINIKIKGTQKEYNAELQENEHMHLEVDSSGDKIPVPNGYVGSKVAGENEIDTGYVIYEGEEVVTDENVEEAQRTRNQYVWVPVPDASKMYGIDENGKKWGKLYDFTMSTGNNIDEITGAKQLNWTETNGIIKISSKTGYREPDVVLKNSNNTVYDMDSKLKNLTLEIKETHEFLEQLEKEFNYMIESIEKYGGFYIGRYETGNLSKEKVSITKGNLDTTSQTWYTMYKKCKDLSNENKNIGTGIIWGNQYDRTLMWLIESGNKTKEDICQNSQNWGNYRDSTFEYVNSNGVMMTKNQNSSIRIPTGSTEYTNSNNIYDLAGNVWDWTMEASSTVGRASRGGNYGINSYSSYRFFYVSSNIMVNMGCRAMLYINTN